MCSANVLQVFPSKRGLMCSAGWNSHHLVWFYSAFQQRRVTHQAGWGFTVEFWRGWFTSRCSFDVRTSKETSVWSIQITSLMGLGRMGSESGRKKAAHLSVRGLALFSATHRAGLIALCTYPGYSSSRRGTEHVQEHAYAELESGHTHCLDFFFFPEWYHLCFVEIIKFTKLRD